MNTQTKTDKTLTLEYLEWHAKLTSLPIILTDKIHSTLYKRYKKKTGLNPWINFESSQIEEDTDNYMSHNCIIKISNVFNYTDSETKCLICNVIHTRNWSCLGKNDHYCSFHIDQKKVIIAIQDLLEIQVSVPNKTQVESEKSLLRLVKKGGASDAFMRTWRYARLSWCNREKGRP
ncbi:hypothetical protein Glove_364g16 [Diversispora epigaea]|uniref:Uncharacterized protein n=1 Tax=Diversispora epigaea TaxID=1348612 RepID=A0A397HCR3_9GLOM|nr:hypothetical protein Glove_364g16 [Diversispora epigaea]